MVAVYAYLFRRPGMNAHSTPNKIFLHQFHLHRGLAFGAIIVTALIAFEIFNYSTTDFALSDLLGDLKFLGIRWATILSIAFCGIDFAGIARLFTPEAGNDEGMSSHGEAWYLFGAWLLAATMNAMLTWWGVSLAVLGHQTLGNDVVSREVLLRVVPIFVAVLVWLIRVLIIGTFSVAGDRLFSQEEQLLSAGRRQPRIAAHPSQVRSLGSSLNHPRRASAQANRPAPRPIQQPTQRSISKPSRHMESNYDQGEISYSRPEPTYHPLSASSGMTSKAANSTASSPSKYSNSKFR
jgi:hypothetical protein